MAKLVSVGCVVSWLEHYLPEPEQVTMLQVVPDDVLAGFKTGATS